MHSLPTRRIAIYLFAGLVVLIVGVIGLWSLRGHAGAGGDEGVVLGVLGEAETAQGLQESLGGGSDVVAGSSTTTTTARPEIWVQVAGAVMRPGVYQVPDGSRVFEAVLAAGGFAEGADQQGVALAARVTDGCRVYVPTEGGPPSNQAEQPVESSAGLSGGAGPGAGSTGAGGVSSVSLNEATAEQFDMLPGVGPALAQQIVAYREANGPFTSVDQLDEVPGIGPAKLEQLRPLVTL